MIEKEVSLSAIKPYNRNPRDNREAVQYVAESIRRFGYRNYIHVDRDLVIICGHTRYLALKQLGFSRVRVVIDDDMTPEQIKAFRLADNKVSEFAKWKPDLLNLELEELAELDISMLDLGFQPVELNVIGNEPQDENENSYYGDERERTNEAYNLHAYDPDDADGFYNIPHLKRTSHVPERLITGVSADDDEIAVNVDVVPVPEAPDGFGDVLHRLPVVSRIPVVRLDLR